MNIASLHRAMFVALLIPAACKGGDSSGKSSGKTSQPPAAASNGAPVTFVVDKVTAGPKGRFDGEVAARAYNFADKKIASYVVVARYYDKAGAVLPVKPGTPFEESYDNHFFSGQKFVCAPKAWCDIEIKGLNIPAGTVKAEILATELHATDGVKIDNDNPLFKATERGWPGADKEPVKWPAAFADFADATKAQAAWQGAWAGDGFSLGNAAAWQVAGDKVSFFDKKGEQQFTLSIDSPCSAGFGGGKDGGWISTFTLRNGELITGLGDAGYRKGNTALVCGGGKIWQFDGTKCTKWDFMFRKWQSEEGKCGLRQEEGKDIFFYQAFDSESKVPVEGDTIWSTQLANSHAKKHPDLAAAKAAQGL